MPMIVQHNPIPNGVTRWATAEEAVVAAIVGCQRGLGGMFPNGTAEMFVNPVDRQGYADRKAQLDELADDLRTGRAKIVWTSR